MLHYLHFEKFPNYFSTPGLGTWWGDPVRWEIAVLVVAAISLTALCSAVLYSVEGDECPRTLLACAFAAPLVFGAFASALQIHLLLRSLARAGWASPFRPEDLMWCQSYSAQVGFLCSAALLVLWPALSALCRIGRARRERAE